MHYCNIQVPFLGSLIYCSVWTTLFQSHISSTLCIFKIILTVPGTLLFEFWNNFFMRIRLYFVEIVLGFNWMQGKFLSLWYWVLLSFCFFMCVFINLFLGTLQCLFQLWMRSFLCYIFQWVIAGLQECHWVLYIDLILSIPAELFC